MDQGKTIRQARDFEIPRCVANLRYYADLVKNYHEISTELEGPIAAQSVTRHEPLGVVGIIIPWNLPLYLLTWKVAPALIMGNCVVAKPSEWTSLTAYKLSQLVKDAGFPEGALNIVFGYGHEVGQAIVEHPSIRAISFTGGTVTGRKIAAGAAILGKKVSLELGGKNPGIIFADCIEDLDTTVAACIKSSFANQGQICLCTSRIYVENTIYDRFLDKFTTATKALKVGDPFDEAIDLGAIVSAEHQKKILSYIEAAKEQNATIICGGEKMSCIVGHEGGFFVQPTVIANIPHNSPIIQEEIFGPVVTVIPFESEEEVVRLANDVSYGLAASVWTKNGKRAQRVARQIKSGVVWINCWMIRDLATPFGGVKASGYGREGGSYSLEFFSDIKVITSAL